MKDIPEGTTMSYIAGTDASDGADAIGNTGVAVVSTVAVITMVEECCGRLAREYLDEDEATVGTVVNVTHRAASPIGTQIETVAVLSERPGRRLVFDVTARAAGQAEGAVILDGRHERVVIKLSSFLEGAREAAR